MVVSNNTPSINPRLGHAVAGKNAFVTTRKKGPCRANRFREKAVDISNLFREALGLPLIKPGSHDDSKLRILPFIGTPTTFASVNGKEVDGPIRVITFEKPPPHHHGHHGHGGPRHHKGGHHHLGRGSFINRIHYSLMNLGRWEGRAVAFVLGKNLSFFSMFDFLNCFFFLIRLRNWSFTQGTLCLGRCHVPLCEGTTW